MSRSTHVWKYNNLSGFGLANLISEKIGQYEWTNPGSLTDVRGGKEILLACDYGGHHKSSLYESYAFLVANISDSCEWYNQRKWLRSVVLTDGRRISFKGIRGRTSIRVLRHFLTVANSLSGLLVTFLIDKRLGRLISVKPDLYKFPELVYPERGWNNRSFNRLSLIAHLGSLLIGGLCGKGQDLLWITDQDEIAPNPKKHDHAGWILWYYLCKYAPQIGGKLVFVTTEADLEKRWIEDVVSIADLSAGAWAEVVSSMLNQLNGDIVNILIPVAQGFSKRTECILNWFARSDFSLSRLVVILQYDQTLKILTKVGGPCILLFDTNGTDKAFIR